MNRNRSLVGFSRAQLWQRMFLLAGLASVAAACGDDEPNGALLLDSGSNTPVDTGDGDDGQGDGDVDGDDAGPGDGNDAGDGDANDASTDAGPEPSWEIEIRGRWHGSFGGEEVIASETWSGYLVTTIIQYDNEENFAITQNPADALYGPSKFNKVVWTELANGSFYYCSIAYSEDSAEAALNSPKVADATDPETTGCGTFPWTKLSPALEIGGRWHTNFGGEETIDSDFWTSFGTTTVIEYDNGQNWAVLQNPADDAYNPSKFSKVVWTELANGAFYYCTVDLGLATAQEAKDTTETADASDPENGGCGTFPWTGLTPALEIGGKWHGSFGGEELIDSDFWTSYGESTVIDYDNGANWAITQNPADDAYNPNKFNKIVWTELASGSFYYCTVDFGLATEQAARDSTKTADASNPASGGCGTFPWTQLSPAIEIGGTWEVDTASVVVDSDTWDAQTVISYDNKSGTAVTQNPDEGDAPLKFNKLVWANFDGEGFSVCTLGAGLDSAALAEAATGTVDADDLATGCKGGEWTVYEAP